MFQDLDTVGAEKEFVVHGIVVDIDEAEDPEAIEIILEVIGIRRERYRQER